MNVDLTVAKKDLLRLANRATGVADKKNTMPVLACVLLEADEGLTVKATDLHQSVRGTVTAEVRRKGSVAVNARDLQARISAMPDGPVLVSADDKRVTLKAAGTARRYTMDLVPASEYPALPDPPEEAQRLDVSAERLRRLVGAVKHAISQDDTRANLNSMLLLWTHDKITTVATDGHRLAKCEHAHACESSARLLIPLKAVAEIERLASEVRGAESTIVQLVASERELFVEAGGVTFSTKLVEASFPSYDKVIPKQTKKRARIPRAATLDAVKAVKLAANDRTGGVKLTFAPGVLTITGESPTSGDGADEVAIDYDGPEVTVGVNGKYVEDLFPVADATDDLDVSLGGDLDPLRFDPSGVEGENFTAIIMPMRL